MLNLNILNFGHHCALFLKETMLQIKASFVATSETDIFNFSKSHLLQLKLKFWSFPACWSPFGLCFGPYLAEGTLMFYPWESTRTILLRT